MKKIYMIMAAMMLLTLSLNAQKLPAKKGSVNFMPTGTATLVDHNGQFMMPTLASNEYLFGPYVTDDFDATGISYANYYNTAQTITTIVDLTRSEFEEHLGDSIIGFRFALAGSNPVNVYNFIAYPGNDNYWDNADYRHVWTLGELGNSGDTPSGSVTVGDGTSTNEYLPVYGYYYDYSQQNQLIYTADQLGLETGTQITSLTFYTTEGINFSGGNVTISLGTTTETSWSTDGYGYATAISGVTLTEVASFVPATSSTSEWTINFNTPFTYNGNNLLVQIDTEADDYGHTYFYGNTSNYSFYSYGSYTRSTNQFQPKVTIGYGESITPEYLSLAGGQWHDFYLDEPVEFQVSGDTITSLSIGYTYYQENSSDFAPTAVNSNSTGHNHMSYMYARTSSSSSYTREWWNDGTSGSDNSDRPGDLAVQLIFKSSQEKTETPVITYTTADNGVTITATGNGTVTLTVGGQTVTGTGSASITLGRGSADYTVTATATAQEDGKSVSDEATQTITIPATELDPTPAPTISSNVLDLSVEVTGSGTGEVHFYVDGQEVTSPYYAERLESDYTIEVVITAQEDGMAMTTTTQTITVPARGTVDLTGWTELSGTYTDNDVIDLGKYMMFVDRFTASTAENTHAPKYTYIMTENKTDGRSTNSHIIPVMKTGSVINGYYTEEQVLNDTLPSLDVNILSADVEMYLEHSTDIYYYTLDRSTNSTAEVDYLELTNLQRNMDNTYREMGDYYTYGELFDYGTVHRMDTVGGLSTGTYAQDYRTYVPIVWTFGNDVSNKRANWDNDGLHNSYGSPIWETGVGSIGDFTGSVQRQTGHWATWTAEGQDCSLFLAQLHAHGYLPGDGNANVNVDYKPYMFRIWVVCDGLRAFTKDATTGTYVDNGALDSDTLWLADVPCYQVIDENTTEYTQDLNIGNIDWNVIHNNDLVFGAFNDAKPTFIIRFYYRTNSGHVSASTLMANGDDTPGYYPAEGSFDPGNPGTGVSEMQYLGEEVSKTYYNAQGMQSDKPFDGLNIVVTRYSDGTTRTVKVLH